MISHLKEACSKCRMCGLGRTIRGGYDSHVFSDHDPIYNSPQFMIIECSPGWAEVKECRPLAGRVGDSFEKELFVWDRTQFYITNAVKCHTEEPTPEQIEKCEPFLRMEIAIFKPKLVVTLGHVAFNMLCDGEFSERIGQITRSEKFGIKVFAIHRPTTENMPSFVRDMKTLNRIMTYYLTPF